MADGAVEAEVPDDGGVESSDGELQLVAAIEEAESTDGDAAPSSSSGGPLPFPAPTGPPGGLLVVACCHCLRLVEM